MRFLEGLLATVQAIYSLAIGVVVAVIVAAIASLFGVHFLLTFVLVLLFYTGIAVYIIVDEFWLG